MYSLIKIKNAISKTKTVYGIRLNYLCLPACALSLFCGQVNAFCSDAVSPSVNASDYIKDDIKGVVSNGNYRLMWSQCSLGQSWSESDLACIGSPNNYQWGNALKAANSADYAGYTDWRLPNIKELSSIIERQCADPAINSNLFLGTLSEPYWTSTPVFATGSENRVWAVQFDEGSNNKRPKSSIALVRLVRNLTAD